MLSVTKRGKRGNWAKLLDHTIYSRVLSLDAKDA